MASNVVSLEDSLLANLSCSLCLNLYAMPKLMSSCSHTFCLECIKQIKTTINHSGFPEIRCPECRKPCAFNGLTKTAADLQTNIGMKTIVELVKSHQDAVEKCKEDKSACLHFYQTENRTFCPHCSRSFCESCKFRHMEELKLESTEKAKTILDRRSAISANEAAERMKKVIVVQVDVAKADVRQMAEQLKSVITAAIDEKVDACWKQLDGIQEAQTTVANYVVGTLTSAEKAESIKRQLDLTSSTSVLRQQIETIASFSHDVTEQDQLLEFFDAITSFESSILTFEPNKEFNEMAEKLKVTPLGEIEVNPATVDISSRLPRFESEIGGNAGDFDVKSAIREAFKHAMGCANFQNFASALGDENASYSEDNMQVVTSDVESEGEISDRPSSVVSDASDISIVNEASRPLQKLCTFNCSDVKKIIAIPSNSQFVALHGDNKISVFDPSGDGVLVSSVRIDVPSLRNIQVDDVASDDGNTFVITMNFYDRLAPDCNIIRNIFRYQTKMGTFDDVEPSALCYRTLTLNYYRGLAICSTSRLLFSTHGNDIIAFSLIKDPGRGAANVVFRCPIGPSPHVVGVIMPSASEIRLLCTTDCKMVCQTIQRCNSNDNNTMVAGAKEELSLSPDLAPFLLRNPNALCLWGKNNQQALLLRNEKELVMSDSFSWLSHCSGILTLKSSTRDSATVSCGGLAVLKRFHFFGGSLEDLIALFPVNGNKITVFALPS